MTMKREEGGVSIAEQSQRSDDLKSHEEGSGRSYLLHDSLRSLDPATHQIIAFEDERQLRKLIFIASESICPRPVQEAVSSTFSNIYAEGYPALRMSHDDKDLLLDFGHMLAHHRRYADRRYYKGCDFANFVEALAQKRAAQLFATDELEGDGPKVSAEEIFVNVQPLSGAAANNAVYDAFLSPGDSVLGLNLAHGGHLTHGSPANRSGKMFKAAAYGLDPKTETLDYDAIQRQAEEVRPKLLIAGFSAYPLHIDWAALRKIADSVDAILLADVAHSAGLIAGRCFPSPVGYADVVSLTTHKTLCGPRGAIILTTDESHAKRIDRAVFPGEQGGPHLNAIAGKAVAFLIAQSESFRSLQRASVTNAQALAQAFQDEGLRVCSGGTQSHLCLVDLKPLHPDSPVKLSGEIASRILDLVGITCNKNTIAGDRNAAHPSGLRFGATWVTQRGLGPADMQEVARVVGKLLNNIHPFSYLHRKQVGRGKIEIDLLQECRDRVAAVSDRASADRIVETQSGYPHDFPLPPAKPDSQRTLLREAESLSAHVVERGGKQVVYSYGNEEAEVAATREGCALFELSDFMHVEVEGWRASLFLHEICAGDVLNLAVGACTKSALLDRHGEVQDVITILRREKDRHDRDRYSLLLGPERSEWILEWLRAVSDGYVLFDEDLHRKVQGPVTVFDRTRSPEKSPSRIYRAVGPQSGAILASLDSSLANLGPGQSITLAEVPVTILRPRDTDEFEIFAEESCAPLVVESFKKSGATLAGVGARDRYEAPIAEADRESLLASRPDLFDAGKPFFVGRAAFEGQRAPTTDKETWSFAPEEKDPIPSCLYEEHLKRTRPTYMVPFAGWKMPLQYTSIAEEHEVVRNAAGLFDVSHMGILGFRGEHAARFLDLVTANYVHWLDDGQAQYSYVFAPDGHVLDDVLVYRRKPDDYMMVVNAANTEKIKSWISAVASGKFILYPEDPSVEIDVSCEITDLKTEGPEDSRLVDLALQGPTSWDVLRVAGGENQAVSIQNLRRFDFIEGEVGGMSALISRTGYTGEEVGYELYVRPGDAPAIWNLLLEKGEPFGIRPVGLGARDSTRAEAGLPLYGHELGGELDLVPSEVGYGSFVKVHKPFFIGRQAYQSKLAASSRTTIRFRTSSSGARRIKPGDPMVDSRGQSVGVVTSSVLVKGSQQGLACVQKKAATKDSTLHVFPLPEGGRATQILSPGELPKAKIGSRTLLPVDVTVLSRFPKTRARLPKITARRR